MKSLNKFILIHKYIAQYVGYIYIVLCPAISLNAEDELIKYGDFDSWITRSIKESRIVGGETKTLYEIGPKGTFDGERAFTNQGGCPWANSNVYAKVAGVVKTNVTVYPDDHNGGKAAKLCTQIVKCKAIGVMNISVLAAGSVFLGSMLEPVTSSKDPMSKINVGIPFTRRPKALKIDYKYEASKEPNRIYESGFGKTKTIQGADQAEMTLLLQKRWEDANGNIHAKRVGTMRHRIGKSTDGWKEDSVFDIHYGNISKESFYKDWMKLLTGDEAYYALNSKGENVPIQEEGWAGEDEEPTHIILKFDSSYGSAYVGSVGSTLWIDNVRLVY